MPANVVLQTEFEAALKRIEQLEKEVSELKGQLVVDTVKATEMAPKMPFGKAHLIHLIEIGVLPGERLKTEKGIWVTSRRACVEYANSLIQKT